MVTRCSGFPKQAAEVVSEVYNLGERRQHRCVSICQEKEVQVCEYGYIMNMDSEIRS